MSRFTKGDRVRVDLPDESDPDHDRYHGEHGTIVAVFEDKAGDVTGEERDDLIFRVEFESEETMDFRWRDLRPPIE